MIHKACLTMDTSLPKPPALPTANPIKRVCGVLNILAVNLLKEDRTMNYANATQCIDSLNKGEVSAKELVDFAIARIEALDEHINAVVTRDFDRARADAATADKERKAGSDKPLLGLPVTVKEGFDVEGLVTSWGLPGEHAPAGEDSVLVRRLRAAGAIILGKSNIATMLADWQCANPRFGRTNNPWNPDKTPGGSSGGGAAAVAADMVALEFGSDLAGSLRIPAAFCGVFAHRPSQGVVPMRGFAPPMAPRLPIASDVDQAAVGPIARSALDLELALGLVAGPDGLEAEAYRLALPPAGQKNLRDFRVLVLDKHPLCPTASAVQSAIAEVAKHLEEAGCKVARKAETLPSLTDIARTFQALLMSLMGVDTPRDDYDTAKDADDFDSQAMTMSHRDWVELDRHRLGLQLGWKQLFSQFDVVVCPAAPVTAFSHDERPFGERRLTVDGSEAGYDILPLWSSLTNPTGLPSTTMPIGADAGGMPIGMQVVGKRYGDLTTLRFAALVEAQFGGFRKPTSLV
ncbi:amidase [Nitratireductor sp. ZSWI3]|uniref:amidase n=1 Tax=Nitratireductor sp. ZSWI3 TaxID=2966359 RepID=UPI00214FD4F9|nr:amidase [Nitratireductor sp. ZSWI3]MCR4266632.1 amidase [Nitratireductor sp. ZSWI3]